MIPFKGLSRPCPAAGWVQQPVLPVLAELSCALCSCTELQSHWGSQQDCSVELRLVQLLMPALPALAVALRLPAERRPPGCSWETATNLMAATNLLPLQPARDAWLVAADRRGLLGVLCGEAQLLAMMPLPPQQASAAETAKPSFLVAVNFLAAPGCSVRYAQQRIAQQSEQEQLRVASSLLAVLARLPSLAALVSCPNIEAGWGQTAAAVAQSALIDSGSDLVQLLLAYAGKG